MIADRMIILAQGNLIADMTVAELAETSLGAYVKVRCENNNEELISLLTEKGADIKQNKNKELHVHHLEMKQIGLLAKEKNLALYELTKVQPSLEELFVELTEGKMDYVSTSTTPVEGRELK